MPWVQLVHGLDQQQFPRRSKESYQVPDFLLLVETRAREHRPLLVEVKRAPRDKSSLKLPEAQVALCESYASALQIPLVYAVYWERLSGWTLNTSDSFEKKSSSRKLPLTTALELDCGAILGDVSHFMPSTLVRVSRFSAHDVTDSSIRHEKYGRVISDIANLGERKVAMNGVESAALDSMLTMASVKETALGSGETELIEKPDSNYVLKLSSWITRHLATFDVQPSENDASTSAYTILALMEKLGCPRLHPFPLGRSNELERLNNLFRTPKRSRVS